MRVSSIYMCLLACLSIPFFSNCCITPKAYCGSKVSDSEMFQVSGEKDQVNINGKNYLEATLLVRIDSQVVGSYQKGWPKYVKAKAGERAIEIRHYRGWNARCNKPTIAVATKTGCTTPDYHKHYLLRFKADKEKKYLISFRSKTSNTDIPDILLIDKTTGKPISCQVEIMNQNELTSR
ncbi:MAG: putative rane protein [Bacteroidetes bacterium]|jgi:hypothetical protein|nr:putative rane protein [Bacteroidota bacterium]